MCVCVYVCMRVCMYVCVCVRIYVCMYVCMHVSMYVYQAQTVTVSVAIAPSVEGPWRVLRGASEVKES